MKQFSKSDLRANLLDRDRLDQHCAAEGATYSMGVSTQALAECSVGVAVVGAVLKAASDTKFAEVAGL